MKNWWAGGLVVVLVIGAVVTSGCNKEDNSTVIIEQGNFTYDLVTDMQYKPLNLPLSGNETIPKGLVLMNQSSGVLVDGNLLFRGTIRNNLTTPTPGYIIVYLELQGNNSRTLLSSYPLVSQRNVPGNGEFNYFYLTNTPVADPVTSYLVKVQVSDQYPGV